MRRNGLPVQTFHFSLHGFHTLRLDAVRFGTLQQLAYVGSCETLASANL